MSGDGELVKKQTIPTGGPLEFSFCPHMLTLMSKEGWKTKQEPYFTLQCSSSALVHPDIGMVS